MVPIPTTSILAFQKHMHVLSTPSFLMCMLWDATVLAVQEKSQQLGQSMDWHLIVASSVVQVIYFVFRLHICFISLLISAFC